MYCISCGKKKRLIWPKKGQFRFWDRVACSQACVAKAYLGYASAGAWGAAYCQTCGEYQDACECYIERDIEDEYRGVDLLF
jgi:hypothetical protein